MCVYDLNVRRRRNVARDARGAAASDRGLGGDERTYGPQLGLGVATTIQHDGRDELVNSLLSQIDDLKARLDRSENERRENFETYRKDLETMRLFMEAAVNIQSRT